MIKFKIVNYNLAYKMMQMRVSLSNRLVPSWIIFTVDLTINTISIFFAYLLRFNFNIPAEYTATLFPIVFAILTIKSILYYIGRTHSNIVRYISIRELVRLLIIILLSTLVLGSINLVYFILAKTVIVPFSILIIDFFISAFALVLVRMLVKVFFSELKNNSANKTNAVIFGTEELAVSVKRVLDMDPESSYKFVAFIDNEKDTHKKMVEGINIYNYKKLDHVIRDFSVKSLIIAKSQISPALKNNIVEKCLKMNVKVMFVQNVKSWIKGGIDVKQIKNIRIEDLLERDPIILDTTEIRKKIGNKTILVTGAAGSIGSEIVRQVSGFSPYKIIMLDQAETPLHNIEIEMAAQNNNFRTEIVLADITNSLKLKHLFETQKIDIIYHAAAYKHVPMMERHPTEAVKNNIYGTKLLADFAVRYKVPKFVMISTDKAVNPTNVMGASKRISEIYTQSLNEFGLTNFITTRFGNVLGSNGSVIPLFKKQIENGGPVTVTDPEVSRYFMTIPEACQLVLEASAMGNGGEIFIFDMGKSIKVIDIAKNMIRLSGLEVGKDIGIKFVGLRPGEKLYEELLCDRENSLPTHHPKIMIVKVAHTDVNLVSDYLNTFEKLIKNQNNIEMVKLMKKVVPEYLSQNSIYEILDKENVQSKLKGKISVN
jgi:FlaA1/EpsC-like NDP-sugar epimerase